MKTVLFIDDEQNILNSFKRSLTKEKDWLTMHFASNHRDAEKILSETVIDAVIADYKMPEKDGLTLLREIEKKYPDTFRILLTGSPEKNL